MTIDLGWQAITGIISLVVLLSISGLISGTEVAFFSLSKTDLEDESNLNIKQVNELLEGPKKLLATILIGNNLVNVAIVIVSSIIINEIFPSKSQNFIMSFITQVVSVTFIILLFGEVIPKVYANNYNIRF